MLQASLNSTPQSSEGWSRAFTAPAPSGQARVAVLLNGRAKRVSREVRRGFEQLVPSEDLYFSESLDDSRSICRSIVERRYGVLLTGGGDGTIMRAMNDLISAADDLSSGLFRPPLPDLGVLRLGTGNALASATRAGRPLEDTALVLSGRRPAARPLPLLEERESGEVSTFGSIGYDAQLLNDYLETCQEESGPALTAVKKSLAGYFYALFTRTVPQQIKSEQPRLHIVARGRASMIDPKTKEEIPLAADSTLFEGSARAVAFGTTPYYGFKMKIFPYAERRPDRFHLRVSVASIPYLLTRLPALWDGTIEGAFVDFLVEGATIESNVALPYQVGGDGRGYRDRLEVGLSPRTFRILDRN